MLVGRTRGFEDFSVHAALRDPQHGVGLCRDPTSLARSQFSVSPPRVPVDRMGSEKPLD